MGSHSAQVAAEPNGFPVGSRMGFRMGPIGVGNGRPIRQIDITRSWSDQNRMRQYGGQLFVIVATPLLDPQDRLELMGPVRAVSARPG
jgi:hypothetical protein